MSFLITEIIANKKQKKTHTAEEIEFLIREYTKGTIPDYQMAAWLMASLLNGLSSEEAFLLTKEVVNSGVTLDFSDLPFPTVDKHSTGGVGDKTSLLVGPIVASAEIGVPMIAGRSLGHTGGTVDKLESIPGFNAELSLEKFKSMVKKNKLCIIGQTADLCPADKKMYALRDVTSTIDSIPIICASIMSKKIAEGMGALVLDIKYGNGAFMQTTDAAADLAKLLISVGRKFDKKVTALVTNMNQPLGKFAGNSLEVKECLDILKNENHSEYTDTIDLTYELAADMFYNVGKVKSFEEGKTLAAKILASGAAHEKFQEMVTEQGGQIKKLPEPVQSTDVLSPLAGYIKEMNTKDAGNANVILGAGRMKSTDVVNPVAGFKIHRKVGDHVERGEPIWTLYSHETKKFDEAKDRLLKSIKLTTETVPSEKLLWKRIH